MFHTLVFNRQPGKSQLLNQQTDSRYANTKICILGVDSDPQKVSWGTKKNLRVKPLSLQRLPDGRWVPWQPSNVLNNTKLMRLSSDSGCIYFSPHLESKDEKTKCQIRKVCESLARVKTYCCNTMCFFFRHSSVVIITTKHKKHRKMPSQFMDQFGSCRIFSIGPRLTCPMVFWCRSAERDKESNNSGASCKAFLAEKRSFLRKNTHTHTGQQEA